MNHTHYAARPPLLLILPLGRQGGGMVTSSRAWLVCGHFHRYPVINSQLSHALQTSFVHLGAPFQPHFALWRGNPRQRESGATLHHPAPQGGGRVVATAGRQHIRAKPFAGLVQRSRSANNGDASPLHTAVYGLHVRLRAYSCSFLLLEIVRDAAMRRHPCIISISRYC